jgi:hypothetical protein
MPRIKYKRINFRPSSLAVVNAANMILKEYEAQGFDLTLRQLYYQFVSRGLIANSDREYKKLGSIVNDARLGGLIDWNHIVDRTRFLRSLPHWDTPEDIIEAAAQGFAIEKWADQPYHVEVWIEKDALVGVIEGVCSRLDVGYLSCRGYTSQSEMWSAAQRLGRKLNAGKRIKIVHLGDHDPSGIDMTRDIDDRLTTFLMNDHYAGKMVGSTDKAIDSVHYVQDHFKVDRVALTWEQIEEYEPPPNPAKLTDSRGAAYVEQHGYESWELDALEPSVIATLIEDAVYEVRDADLWADAVEAEREQRENLTAASERWDDVVAFLNGA